MLDLFLGRRSWTSLHERRKNKKTWVALGTRFVFVSGRARILGREKQASVQKKGRRQGSATYLVRGKKLCTSRRVRTRSCFRSVQIPIPGRRKRNLFPLPQGRISPHLPLIATSDLPLPAHQFPSGSVLVAVAAPARHLVCNMPPRPLLLLISPSGRRVSATWPKNYDFMRWPPT